MSDKRQSTLNHMAIAPGLMAFLANGDNYAASALLTDISKDLGVSYETAALSDRFGKVKIINIAAVGTSIFSILGGFAFDLSLLVLCRAVNGAFGAGIFPAAIAIVGQSFDDEHRHQALARVLGLGFLGAAMATVIGVTLAYFGSWRLVYIFYGMGELILSTVMLKILERDVPVVKKLNFITAYKMPLSKPQLCVLH
ncbi:MAG: MFS transporter [Candidatus Methanomethylophilus sp.]|nr:MFS transporter [Methanomethylophilus sp.]